MTDPLCKNLEQLNLEKQELLNSRAYRLGSRLLHVFGLLRKGRLDLLAADLWTLGANRTRSGRKRNHLARPETDNNSIDWTQEKIAVISVAQQDNQPVADLLFTADNLEYILLCPDPGAWKTIPAGYVLCRLNEDLQSLPLEQQLAYIKTHPEEFAPGSDFVIYLDPGIRPVGDIRRFVNRVHPDSGLAMFNHSGYDDIYSLAARLRWLHPSRQALLARQTVRYKSAGLSGHFGMNDSRVLCTDLNNPRSHRLLEAWWKEQQKAQTGVDELSWPFVLYEHDILIEEIGNLGNRLDLCPRLDLQYVQDVKAFMQGVQKQ